MTFLKTWEEFEKSAETVYLQNSMNVQVWIFMYFLLIFEFSLLDFNVLLLF